MTPNYQPLFQLLLLLLLAPFSALCCFCVWLLFVCATTPLGCDFDEEGGDL